MGVLGQGEITGGFGVEELVGIPSAASSSEDAALQKRLLRADLLALREGENSAVRAATDARIKTQLVSLPSYQAAQTVFCYISVGSEVDTQSLIIEMLASGKSVCVPLCEGGGHMHARLLSSLDDLEDGVWGIPAPPEKSPRIAPAEIDIIIVPCLSCDSTGYRIGYGGGYYDRYIEQLIVEGVAGNKPITLALCRENLLQETVPREEHDQPVDIVVTEKAVLYPGSAPPGHSA